MPARRSRRKRRPRWKTWQSSARISATKSSRGNRPSPARNSSSTSCSIGQRAPQNSRNRNPLLALGIGADGLKTGHTSEAGYGLVGSAVQGGRRVVFVISGLDSDRARAEEAEAIVNWAFRQFAEATVIDAGTVVAEAQVWMGAAKTVGLVPVKDVSLLIPVLGGKDVKAEVVFTGPFQAPLAQGEERGKLIIHPEGLPDVEVPLVTDRAVPAAGFLQRIQTVASLLLKRLGETS